MPCRRSLQAVGSHHAVASARGVFRVSAVPSVERHPVKLRDRLQATNGFVPIISAEWRVMSLLQNPPFLSEEEFNKACELFLARTAQLQTCRTWSSTRLVRRGCSPTYLKITRLLGSTREIDNNCSQLVIADGVEEEDHEALSTQKSLAEPQVEYHVVLSPSYGVPVLYLLLKNVETFGRDMISTVYERLVPSQLHAEMQDVGMLGAISYGDHPVLNIPAIFVHPCNTAQAMSRLDKHRPLRLEEYIQAWLGIAGNCVGLHVPLNVAMVGLN